MSTTIPSMTYAHFWDEASKNKYSKFGFTAKVDCKYFKK